jgi:hypothetical protein
VVLIYPLLVWAIAPYSGWDPRHDILFAALMIVCAGGAVWFHTDTLRAAMPAF